jgi:hypothetical protein
MDEGKVEALNREHLHIFPKKTQREPKTPKKLLTVILPKTELREFFPYSGNQGS